MNPRSIRFRLIGWYGALALAAFVAVEAYTYSAVRHYLEISQITTLYKRAQRIGDTLLVNVDRTGEDFVREEIHARFSPETDDRFIRVLRPDRSTLYVSGSPVSGSFDPKRISLPDDPIKSPVYRETLMPGNAHLLVLAVPYNVGPEAIPDRGRERHLVPRPGPPCPPGDPRAGTAGPAPRRRRWRLAADREGARSGEEDDLRRPGDHPSTT